jgi:type II secretory pathway component PulF
MTLTPEPVTPAYDPGDKPVTRFAIFLFVWIPAALFVLGLASCILGAAAAVIGLIWGPVLAFFIVYAIRRNQTVQRERRAMIVLSYIENAVRLNLPLDRFLQAAEASEFGGTRYLLSRIRQMLQRGYPIGTALEAATPEIPERFVRSVAAAEQVGQLQPALTRILRNARRNRPTLYEDNQPFYRFYLFFLLFIVLFVGTAMMIFVVPKYRDIFKDFHTTLPTLSQYMIDFSDWIANDYGWIFLVPCIFLLIYLIARELQKIFMPALLPVVAPQLREWLAWHLPFVSTLQHDHALTDVFEYIADATRAGIPLPDALQAALVLRMNYHIRDRLMQWRYHILAGMTPAAAARKARLPELLAGFLETGETPRGPAGNRGIADMFDFLARYYRDRFSRLLITLRAIAEPVSVLVVGSLVGVVVLSLFLPLVKLIESVTGGGVTTNGVL